MRKLNRIALINAAGFDYVEFPVGGHSQVIGVNGHGKSTLLSTILFFYLGTNEKAPYALHETKTDFVSHYLGDPPSYLIYEVSRSDGEPAYHIAVTRPSSRIQFLFIDAQFRKEYYVKNLEPRDPDDPKYTEWEQTFEKVKGTADVIIAKQRHGPTGTVKLAFQSEFTRFTDLADPSFTQYEH